MSEAGAWNWSGERFIAYSNGEMPHVLLQFGHPVPAGNYQVFAWIGEKLKGEARYELFLNEVMIKSSVVSNEDGQTSFRLLGDINIPDNLRDNFVTVRLKPNSSAGVLASDLILITPKMP